MSDEQNGNTITEDEAALYDRQIRLWGLDAQKRYKSETRCGRSSSQRPSFCTVEILALLQSLNHLLLMFKIIPLPWKSTKTRILSVSSKREIHVYFYLNSK